jgi:cyclase
MPRILIIFILLNFYNPALPSMKEDIISKMKSTNNLSFNFTQTINDKRENGMCVLEYPKKIWCKYSGAGELLVTSMDRDGTQIGYDNDLMFKISSTVNIPVIASGGVGNLDHLVDGIKLGNASAVLAASIFHYGTHSIKEAKQYLNSKGIPVRN